MKVACPSCNASLTIDDKKIPPGGARIKCPTCQNVFPVKPPAVAATPAGAVPLPGGARPTSSPSGAVPLPGISAAAPAATSWEDEPTRAVPQSSIPLPGAAYPDAPTQAMKSIPLPGGAAPTQATSAIPLPGSGGAAIPGATRVAAPPSNVPAPKPATKSGIGAVPLPGISAAKPAPTAWDDNEATRVGDAGPGSSNSGFDVDFSNSATSTVPALGSADGGATASIPLPGGSSPSRVGASSIPLPGGSSPSRVGAGSIPLPGGAAPGRAPTSSRSAVTAAVPLPGAGGFGSSDSFQVDVSGPSSAGIPLPGGADPLEADFGAAPTSAGIPLPGGAATQAVPAFQPDEVPFSDDFGDAMAPAGAAAAGFDFPDLPGDPGEPAAPVSGGFSFDAPPAPAPVSGGFSFDAPPAPAPVSGGFSFDAPPAPAPVSGGFSFDAPPPPAPAPGGFSFDAPPAPAPAPADDLAFDFNAPPPPSAAPAAMPSFGEVDFGGGPPPPAAGGGDLEFDPTAAPKRSDDLEADLSAPLPPSQSRPSGPADGLEMLSFIDDTAKDAGAPQAPTQVRRFHIKRRSGKVFGPFEETVIAKMLEEAQLLGNEEVSLDAETWQPIGSEPAFQAVIAKLMEAPGRSATQMGMPAVEDKPKGPSMEKLKQLYEGRMAAVAVVESKAPVPFIKRVPYIVAGLLVAGVLGAGVFAGVATPYGFFFLKKIFPAKVKPDTREFGYLAQARAGLQKDTYKSLQSARELANQALAVKEYPEARAVWNQTVYALKRRYGADAPGEVQQADGELFNIELLGEKHPEVLKARASSALVAKDADGALALVGEALAREENQDDLELFFLRAEAYLAKKAIGQARSEYEQILKKSPRSARALHALATLHRQQNELDDAVSRYEAALEADADHVASGIELADLLLVVRKDKERGEAALTPLLTKEKKTEMGPAELGKALALQAEVLVLETKPQEALPLFEEALKADPKNAFAKGRLARVLATLNQPEKAYPLFRDASTASPDNLEYAEGYLSTLILLGKMDEATKVVAGANARFPGNAMISYLAGRVSDALDDSKAAEDGYKRAIAADPTIADAYLYLSRLYVRFRRYNDARPVLEQGLEKDAKNAALHVGMGELAYYEREFERAGKEFKEAAELNPVSSEAFRGLSKVALEQDKPDLALSHIEKALELNPRLKGGRLQKGMALWKLQRLPEAVKELEQAREEEPRNTQVVVTLGAVEFEQSQLSNALNHLLSALQSEPSHPDANFYMARVKNATRDHSQAIDAIKRALESDGKNPVYRYWFGRILADAKKTEEAITEFKTAIELDPKYADALESMGRIYVDRGQLKEAIDSFNKVLAVDPARNTARAALGDASTKLDDWNGAIKAYGEAIENDPDNPNLKYAYARLANAYREKGPKQYQKAVEWYVKATKVDPSNGEAFKDLGYLLKDLKRNKEAIEAWKQYLAVSTDDEKAKKVVEDDLNDLITEGK
ncbi:MAG: zinc-ribbon domain-containing protein [Myxococcaceae bacterium]|jgi:predicted Zn finger-like uncharacterized protein|nr:zinc-ribbon domain-containing protein [Myxococcaceae bacterium]